MNSEELTKFVISRLGGYGDKNNLIKEVCFRGNMDWKQAEEFIIDVESQHYSKIAIRQTPIAVLISLGSIIGGIVTMVSSLSYYSDISWESIATRIVLNPSAFLLPLVGIGMILGGIIGIIWQIGSFFSPTSESQKELINNASKAATVDFLNKVNKK